MASMNKILFLFNIVCSFVFYAEGIVIAEESTQIGLLIQSEGTATYNETLEGFWPVLSKQNFNHKFVTKNAKNNREKMELISKEFHANSSIKAVVALGSAAVPIANSIIKNKPVIFGGMNHPGKLDVSGDNITGTTYFINPVAIVNLISSLNPNVKHIGILSEPPEQNAASIVEVSETIAALKNKKIQYTAVEVKKKNEITDKAKNLIETGVEYIIIPTNRLLYSNIDNIRKVSDSFSVPIISFSKKGIASGALIGLTSDNVELGSIMAQMLIDVVRNEIQPSNIPWHFPAQYSILINETTRKTLSVPIPSHIVKIATQIH